MAKNDMKNKDHMSYLLNGDYTFLEVVTKRLIGKFTFEEIILCEDADGNPVLKFYENKGPIEKRAYSTKLEYISNGNVLEYLASSDDAKLLKEAVKSISVVLTSMHFEDGKRAIAVTLENRYFDLRLQFYTTYESLGRLKVLFGSDVFKMDNLLKYIEYKRKNLREIEEFYSLVSELFPTEILKLHLEEDGVDSGSL